MLLDLDRFFRCRFKVTRAAGFSHLSKCAGLEFSFAGVQIIRWKTGFVEECTGVSNRCAVLPLCSPLVGKVDSSTLH